MVLGRQVTWPSQILLAPAVFESIPGRRTMPGVCAVVSGDWVPLITFICLPTIDVLILFLPVKFTLVSVPSTPWLGWIW